MMAPKRLEVFFPSSRIRILMGPMERTSPDAPSLAGTRVIFGSDISADVRYCVVVERAGC